MRTLVLTGYDEGPIEEIGEATTPGKRAWAARNNYDFECVRRYEEGSHPSWQKLRLLEEQLPKYDQILWLDADTLITNPNFSLDALLQGNRQPLIVSMDWGPCSEADRPFHFSMGNFLIRKDPLAFDLLSAAKNLTQFQNAVFWEQSAMQQVARDNPLLRRAISVLPRRVLNAVPYEVQAAASEPWERGDFLAHLTGTSNYHRARVIPKFNFEYIEAYFDTYAYGIQNWDINMAIDKRHAAWLRDILLGKQWRNTLEIGCYEGCSSLAFFDALNRGTIGCAHFSDLHFQDSFRHTLTRIVQEPSRVKLHQRPGHQVMNSASTFDLVFVDGDHTLPVVKEETLAILRQMPECVTAHDVNAQAIGYPGCDGPPFLMKELQKAGYFCIADMIDRPGELTKRGFFVACRTLATYEVALNGYKATCW